MEIMNYFCYNRESSLKYGLYISESSPYSDPERDLEFVSVPGRDGDLIIDHGRYKNIELSFSCFFVSESMGIGSNLRSIKSWLFSHPGEYLSLETSYEPDYFQLASFIGPLEVDSLAGQLGRVEIVFNCKPWLYMKAGQKLQDITQPKSIQNPKGFPCLPYIKITGSGDIRLTVGNLSWDFAGVDEFIEIDSELMDTFKGTLPQNSKKTGTGYPALQPGINHFAWTGNVSKVEVIPRWRTL